MVGTKARSKAADPQIILRAVSAYFNFPLDALSSESRIQAVADARHIAMYLLREDAGMSKEDIGRLLGGRDHSTVIHGIKKVEGLVQIDQTAIDITDIRALMAQLARVQSTIGPTLPTG